MLDQSAVDPAPAPGWVWVGRCRSIVVGCLTLGWWLREAPEVLCGGTCLNLSAALVGGEGLKFVCGGVEKHDPLMV